MAVLGVLIQPLALMPVLQPVLISLSVLIVNLLHHAMPAKQVHSVFGVKIQETVSLLVLLVSLPILAMIGVQHSQVVLNAVKSMDVVGVTT